MRDLSRYVRVRFFGANLIRCTQFQRPLMLIIDINYEYILKAWMKHI